MKILKILDFVGIYLQKMDFLNFRGQKLKISKNRDSQVVELVVLPLRCLFCVAQSKTAPLTAAQRVATFWPKIACSDVTKLAIAQKIFGRFGSFLL